MTKHGRYALSAYYASCGKCVFDANYTGYAKYGAKFLYD